MGNELSRLTADDLRIQLESNQEIIESVVKLIILQAEAKARKLLKKELSAEISYQEIIGSRGTGFMDVYVGMTVDFKTMTTRAKRDVVLSLAKADLSRGQTICLFQGNSSGYLFTWESVPLVSRCWVNESI